MHSKYLNNWLKNSFFLNFYLPFKNSIKEMEESILHEVSKKILAIYPVSSKVDVLDVGCGQGFSTDIILNNLKYKINTYRGVDVNNASIKSHLYRNKRFAYLEEGNIDKFLIEDKFDLIFSLHSLYGINFKTVKKLTNNLKENGKLIVLVNHEKGLINKITKEKKVTFSNNRVFKNFLDHNGIKYSNFVFSYTFDEISNHTKNIWLRYLSLDIENDTFDLLLQSKTEKESLFIIENN